jgi:hypothetical protein
MGQLNDLAVKSSTTSFHALGDDYFSAGVFDTDTISFGLVPAGNNVDERHYFLADHFHNRSCLLSWQSSCRSFYVSP